MKDYDPFFVPKGFTLETRRDGSRTLVPPPPTQEPTKYLGSRAVSREEIEKPAPEKSDDARLSEEQKALYQYKVDFLYGMRESAKGLTQKSGFSDEAIACWEGGIDSLIHEMARYL